MIEYVPKRFNADKEEHIDRVNDIIAEYQRQGYSLTLRQVYYQLVARDIIPNNERSYKNLGVLINDARLAGLISWEAIVDRTRHLRKQSHWDDPVSILKAAANQFSVDKWAEMDTYCEVWVEKDALIDIIAQVCNEWDVNCLSCRGYVSQSTMWESAIRLKHIHKQSIVFHLGDHDPSGIDMSRDMNDRLALFGADVKFERIALNYDQIEAHDPPPNPTKLTDTRSTGYIENYGHDCWELDALEPRIITDLIREKIKSVMDENIFYEALESEIREKNKMRSFVAGYPEFEKKGIVK